jgi:hypothetical protein
MCATCLYRSEPGLGVSRCNFYVRRFPHVRVSVTFQKERSELRSSE